MTTIRAELYEFAKRLYVLLEESNMLHATTSDIVKLYFHDSLNVKDIHNTGAINNYLEKYYSRIYAIIAANVPTDLKRKNIDKLKDSMKSSVDTTIASYNFTNIYKDNRTRYQVCLDIMKAIAERDAEINAIGYGWLYSLITCKK